MKQITDRNTNIELLRLLCMLMIFVWHILVHGYSLKNVDGELIAINNIQLILLSVLSPATYCFMFISGWYGITYSKKRLLHILYLCFTAIAISLLVKFIFLGGNINILYVIFPLTKGTWWFMTLYIVIMVLSPIINAGIDCISKREFQIILIILLYFLLMSMLQFRVNNGSNLLGLLTIYLLAKYMKKYDISLKRINAVKLLLFSSIMMISTIFLCNILKPDKVFVLLSYNNPFIIVMAISMFMFAIQLKPTYISKLNKILSPTLMIYLLTEGIGPFLYEKIATLISNSLCLGILSIILISVSCLLIGYIANLFFYKIYRLIGV